MGTLPGWPFSEDGHYRRRFDCEHYRRVDTIAKNSASQVRFGFPIFLRLVEARIRFPNSQY